MELYFTPYLSNIIAVVCTNETVTAKCVFYNYDICCTWNWENHESSK